MGRAELTGMFVRAAYAGHEPLVKLEDQGIVEDAAVADLLDAILKRRDVVPDFLDVGGIGRRLLVHGLVFEDVGERGLRPLDAGGEHRLAAHVRSQEHMGIRELTPDPCEFADGGVRFRQQRDEVLIVAECRGQRGGHERDVVEPVGHLAPLELASSR